MKIEFELNLNLDLDLNLKYKLTFNLSLNLDFGLDLSLELGLDDLGLDLGMGVVFGLFNIWLSIYNNNNLFKLSLNAFAKKDFELAEKVRNEDIDIDKLYKGFFNSLLEKMSKDSKLAVPGTHMLFISKNLERIGDHATNVAETITYMASGEIKVEPRPKIN